MSNLTLMHKLTYSDRNVKFIVFKIYITRQNHLVSALLVKSNNVSKKTFVKKFVSKVHNLKKYSWSYIKYLSIFGLFGNFTFNVHIQ